jgi:DHA1 family multidrug resistance protein-like MFS transporter
LAASIYSPAHDAISAEFGVSTTVALLPLSFYNLGMAFGPVISSPLSETFGRKAVYLLTTPTFAFFTLGSGLSQSLAALITCRFFAGMFASPGVSLASATISDMAAPLDRGLPLAVYYTIPFVGSLLGFVIFPGLCVALLNMFSPLVGGFVVEGKGWRWTQWTVLFFFVASFVPIVFVHETYKKIILQRRGLGTSQAQRSFVEGFQYFMTKTVIRPVHMLMTEPIVGFVCLYASFQFALLYTFVVASPYVFMMVYKFSLPDQGLSFLGFLTGVIISPIPTFALDRFVYHAKFVAFKEATKSLDSDATEFPPEHRLYGAMIGSGILPTGLFWFAWTARPDIHWICPIIAQAVTILGSLLIYVSANLYMMDTYGPLYGASATGASSLSRYTLSAAFPLFALQMYGRLGVGWATSLLGFFTVAMAPIPWVFYHWGPTLRARSRYERST